MNDVQRQIYDDYGDETDFGRYHKGKVTIHFMADDHHFHSAEDAIFAISQMLFDRFEGFYHETILE